ncbi:hypothetical protein Moror_11190 [Moniliophthora roreri MCA 2997]|uniref:F-box domain-containing protein n=1 Tax=Moniliophthora roreri (strain MCA 2997) TaxID=1381753 RepID=V2W781_MONRO|nr:hypothetical protein Moror_11190 [Moniliophthora roreri MCA 2997]
MPADDHVERSHLEDCNRLLPFNKLPKEIVVLIFSLYVASVQGLAPFHLGWVCWYWCCVSIDCSELWMHISFELPANAIELMLEHSAKAPSLAITTTQRYPMSSQFDDVFDIGEDLFSVSHLRLLSKLFEGLCLKITQLSLFLDEQYFDDLIGASIERFSRLTELHLTAHEKHAIEIQLSIVNNTSLIRHLSLCRIIFPWDTALFSSKLVYLCIDHPQPPELAELLTALSRCPRLQVLQLNNLEISGSAACDQRVQLLELQLLELRSSQGTVWRRLAGALEASRTTHLKYRSTFPSESSVVKSMRSSLSRQLGGEVVDFLSLEFITEKLFFLVEHKEKGHANWDLKQSQGVMWKATTLGSDCREGYGVCHLELCLADDGDHSHEVGHEDKPEVLQAIISSFCLKSLRILLLGFYPPHYSCFTPSRGLIESFVSLPSVLELEIRGWFPDCLYDMLAQHDLFACLRVLKLARFIELEASFLANALKARA